MKGEYKRLAPWGGGAFELARDDLIECCERVGKPAIAGAIRRAKKLGLFGDPLVDFLRSTWPPGWRRALRRLVEVDEGGVG